MHKQPWALNVGIELSNSWPRWLQNSANNLRKKKLNYSRLDRSATKTQRDNRSKLLSKIQTILNEMTQYNQLFFTDNHWMCVIFLLSVLGTNASILIVDETAIIFLLSLYSRQLKSHQCCYHRIVNYLHIPQFGFGSIQISCRNLFGALLIRCQIQVQKG